MDFRSLSLLMTTAQFRRVQSPWSAVRGRKHCCGLRTTDYGLLLISLALLKGMKKTMTVCRPRASRRLTDRAIRRQVAHQYSRCRSIPAPARVPYADEVSRERLPAHR